MKVKESGSAKEHWIELVYITNLLKRVAAKFLGPAMHFRTGLNNEFSWNKGGLLAMARVIHYSVATSFPPFTKPHYQRDTLQHKHTQPFTFLQYTMDT